MPSVVYYNCPEKECVGLVTEEVIHITPDLKHDPHAVKYFTAITLAHVTSRGVNFNEVIEWTDQCPTQYKSKTVFYNMSKSEIKHTHHYFASRHGKNLQMEQLVEPKLLITQQKGVVRYFKVPKNSMTMVKTIC